jgi:hypothetical protein
MPATINQTSRAARTEPPFGGHDDADWFEWADSPAGRAELERQAREVLEFYDRVLKPRHEPRDNGKFIVLDRVSKEYEIDSSSIEARRQLRSRGVVGDFFTLEVGQPLITTGYLLAHETASQ